MPPARHTTYARHASELRELRLDAALTPDEMAEQLSIRTGRELEPETVMQLENGSLPIPADILDAARATHLEA
jgi:transcriptional regulator with XRE-family HTH domain